VEYSNQIPAGIRKQMPRGGKSRFFGMAPIGSKGRDVFFHFYEVPSKYKPSAQDKARDVAKYIKDGNA